jgi:hypothetical protein
MRSELGIGRLYNMVGDLYVYVRSVYADGPYETMLSGVWLANDLISEFGPPGLFLEEPQDRYWIDT